MNALIAEFIGTALLILLGNGVVANVLLHRTKGHAAGWIVIALGWGMAVFVAVFCTAAWSGAHINPAVSIGLAAADRFAWSLVPAYVTAQMLGAFLGAATVFLVYRDHYAATDDVDIKRATFCTGPAIRRSMSNLSSEIIGTFVLVFAVLWAPDPSIQSPGMPTAQVGLGALGALPVGLLVLAIGLSLGGTTGYAINPARDLAPRLAHTLLPIPNKGNSDWSYAWIPVVGPALGGLLAAIVTWAIQIGT